MDENPEKPERERGPDPYHPFEPIKQSRSDEEILAHLARDYHEFVSNKDLLKQKVEFFFSELIQHLTLGIVLNWHRKFKTESYEVMELDNDDDDDDDDDEPDVFTPYDLKKNPVTVTCPNCDRGVAAAKFAPHLEACMGMGRSRSRTATRRGMTNNHSGGGGSSSATTNNNSGGGGSGNCSGGGGMAVAGPSTSGGGGVNFGASCSKDFMPRGGGAGSDVPSTSSASPSGAGTSAGGGVPSDDEDDMDWNPGNKRSKQKKRTRNGSKKIKGGTPKKSESGSRFADAAESTAADEAADEGPSPVNFRDLFQADRHSNSSSPVDSVSSSQSSTATITATTSTTTTPTPTTPTTVVAAASAASSAAAGASSAVVAPAATASSSKGKMSKDKGSKSKKGTKKGGGGGGGGSGSAADRSSPSSNISSSAD